MDDAAALARWEARQEYAEDLHEERRARNAHRCQCSGDMPGHCPGPASCPMTQHDDTSPPPCPRCGEAIGWDGNDGCRDPACPGQGNA